MKPGLATTLALLCSTAPTPAQDPPPKFRVDLEESEAPSQTGARMPDATGTDWMDRLRIYGHVAAVYLDTGNTGYRPEGSFMLREGNLFVEAQATDRISAAFEMFFSRAGSTDRADVTTDEVYLDIKRVLDDDPDALNLRVGIFDLPFGEDYLRRHAVDNPMINYAAGMPYGSDAGIMAYGRSSGIDWIAALTNGTSQRADDDDEDKAVSLKVSGRPADSVYLSASVMRTGDTERSANCFAGVWLMPVGTFGLPSAAGASPSKQINANLYEVDAKIDVGTAAYLMLSFGQAFIEDDAPGFDRDLTWFFVEPNVQISESFYVTARYSEFGTYDSNEGYAMNGRFTAGALGAFGFDAKRLSRVGLALGYHPNPNLWIKAEIGRDRFWVIDSSTFDPGADRREYFALEVVAAF